MNLEARNNQLLMELINKPQITSNILYEKFGLSRSQLNYSLAKINDFLDDEKLPHIKRTKSGYFLVPSTVVSALRKDKEEGHETIKHYVLSRQERIWILELMMLTKEEYLSLNHFIDDLRVSRNTILRDLKKINLELTSHDLNLKYTRKSGYFILGDEWNKRAFLSTILTNLSKIYNGINYIIQFSKIDVEYIEMFNKRISLVEEKLNIQFTDERLKVLPLLFILIIRRAKKGKHISYNFKISDFELADTKEYLAVQHIIWDVDELERNERLYLTLLLLTTNLSQADTLSIKEIDHLQEALVGVLNNFEKISGLILERKEKLLDRLLVHMRPAYYRIKYHLNLQTPFFQENRDSDLYSLFYLVKESSQPLMNFFSEKVPDTELFLISLFVGSHIVDNTKVIRDGNGKRAIIVCPNGISISVLLKNTLENLFPEINFIDVISERKFYQGDYDVDFIFSAVPLNTEKSVFVVNNFLSEKEKRQLRERVIRSLTISKNSTVNPDKIMSLIKRHTTVPDETSLYHELLSLFTPKDFTVLERKRLHLTDILNNQIIQIFEEEVEWQHLLDKLAKPLENAGVISLNFIKILKKEMPALPTYTILKKKIALPHTTSEAGALGVGISIGILRNALIADDGTKVNTVILFASNDKDKHVDLIFELLNLAESKQLKKIEDGKSIEEILNRLIDFSDDYWRNK